MRLLMDGLMPGVYGGLHENSIFSWPILNQENPAITETNGIVCAWLDG